MPAYFYCQGIFLVRLFNVFPIKASIWFVPKKSTFFSCNTESVFLASTENRKWMLQRFILGCSCNDHVINECCNSCQSGQHGVRCLLVWPWSWRLNLNKPLWMLIVRSSLDSLSTSSWKKPQKDPFSRKKFPHSVLWKGPLELKANTDVHPKSLLSNQLISRLFRLLFFFFFNYNRNCSFRTNCRLYYTFLLKTLKFFFNYIKCGIRYQPFWSKNWFRVWFLFQCCLDFCIVIKTL